MVEMLVFTIQSRAVIALNERTPRGDFFFPPKSLFTLIFHFSRFPVFVQLNLRRALQRGQFQLYMLL